MNIMFYNRIIPGPGWLMQENLSVQSSANCRTIQADVSLVSFGKQLVHMYIYAHHGLRTCTIALRRTYTIALKSNQYGCKYSLSHR